MVDTRERYTRGDTETSASEARGFKEVIGSDWLGTGHYRRGPDGEQRNPLETELSQHIVEILGEGVER